MKKLLAILVVLGVVCGASLAAINYPVNSVASPIDMNTSTAGYQGYLYVPKVSAHQIEVYSNITTAPPTLVKTITSTQLGGTPAGIAVSPDGEKVYVSVFNTSNIKIFDKNGNADGTVADSAIGSFGAPRGIAFSPDGKRAYVLDGTRQSLVVINAQTDAVLGELSMGSIYMYGVAVSPDHSYVAVSKRKADGDIFVYKVTHNTDGTMTYNLIKEFAGMPYPTYLEFSPDSSRLYARIRLTSSSPYNDIRVYRTNNWTVLKDITVYSGADTDPSNLWGEGMDLSSNGDILYATHFKGAPDNTVYVYRYKTSDWTKSDVRTTLPSKDCLTFVPDGSRVWITGSEYADMISSRWSGYTDGSGVLQNPIPQAPVIIHPALGDVLDNYIGNAEWTYAPGDTHTYRRYKVDYKIDGTVTWEVLESETEDTTTSLASLPGGQPLVLRVRMKGAMLSDGTNALWGPYAYSERFTKPIGPEIDHVDVKPSGTITWSTQTWCRVWDSVRVFSTTGHGFGEDEGTVQYAGITIPSTAVSWTDSYVEFTMPRSEGSDYIESGAANITVTNGGGSDSSSFTIYPNLDAISPASGLVGTEVRLDGFSFGDTGNAVTVSFDGTDIAATSVRDLGSDYVLFNVPSTTPGVKNVYVRVNSLNSNTLTFEVEESGTPQINSFQVDTDPSPLVATWVDTTEAIVYDHIKILGLNFGADPGDDNRDTATNRVTMAGLVIRDDAGDEGLQVYAWSDTEIEIGIPRRVVSTFIDSGANAVIVRANGVDTASLDLTINPHIYSISPSSGHVADEAVVSGTALEGTRTMYVGGVTASEPSPIVRENGIDPDGTGGNDQVTITIPSAPEGVQPVTATVNSQASNTDITYEILPPGMPNPLVVIPNVAPNTEPIEVHVHGTGFISTTTVTLKKTSETDIVATGVSLVDATELTCTLDITGVALGKWDVEVANGTATATISKGFTVVDSSGEIAQIIDDFEGVAVEYPAGYSELPADPDIDFTMSTTEYHEGDQAAAVSYPTSTAGWRGYNGNCAVMQDISSFDTLSVMVKGDGSSNTAKLQITDIDGEIFASPSTNLISLAGTTWTEYSILISDLVEIDSGGVEIGDASDLNKESITNYQIIFMGNPASLATMNIDFVIAKGYTPVVLTDIPQNLKAARSTADVVLTWDAPGLGEPTDGYQVYTGTDASSVTTALGGLIPAGTYTTTHTGAGADVDDHYYVVRAVNTAVETDPSNMAYILKESYTDTVSLGGSNIFWISVPYLNDYTDAQAIADDINGTATPGDPGTVVEVGRYDTATGVFETLSYLPFPIEAWTGTNFSVVKGEAYYIAVVDTVTWSPAGGNDPTFAFSLPLIGTNQYWISLPYNAAYANARAIVDDANGAPAPGPVDETGRFESSTGLYETLSYLGFPIEDWQGTDFSFNPGEGYYITIGGAVSGWNPSE